MINDNSMSGTNHEVHTFYGSGSQQSERIMGLNNIYEADINKLTEFLQNNNEVEAETKEDISISQRSERESLQKLYQSGQSGVGVDFESKAEGFQSYSKVQDDEIERQLQQYENGNNIYI